MRSVLWLTLVCLCASKPAAAYSVLTHEAIIDTSWPRELKPLLLKRFPEATEEQLREAHAYAYGGAIIQDMGYYPFGSKFFSDLAHYTRSGDFILALLQEAHDLNEYAFALGTLAHYAADNLGHPIAINRTVPMVYPKLGKKYGPEVTYEDDPKAHLKAEFGFDVIEIARGQYASQAYHDFIGFNVAKPVLERAFEDTYSLQLADQFHDLDLALGTYRYAVSQVIPEMTKTAWSAKKKDIEQLQSGITRRKFIYRLSRSSYEREWNKKYEKPGVGARFLAFVFHIIPKIGPFRALAFKVPPPAAEKLFLTSLDETIQRYRELLQQAGENRLQLANQDFDTGRPTHTGEYHLADETYEKLLEKLADAPDKISNPLRVNILAFYDASDGPASEKAHAVFLALKNSASLTR